MEPTSSAEPTADHYDLLNNRKKQGGRKTHPFLIVAVRG